MASAIAVIDKRVGNSPTIAEAFAQSAERVFPGPSDDAVVEDVRVDRRTATNLVFIDRRVADHQTLLAGLDADSEYLLLDTDSDGVLQMAIALAGRRDLASLRMLAHGRPGALMLGASELRRAAVDHHARELAVIGRALYPEGDVQIYGCEVGQGDAGRAFVDALAGSPRRPGRRVVGAGGPRWLGRRLAARCRQAAHTALRAAGLAWPARHDRDPADAVFSGAQFRRVAQQLRLCRAVR